MSKNKQIKIIPEHVWTKNEIRNMLIMSDKAVIHGLMRLYSFQTDVEKVTLAGSLVNGKGFDRVDTYALTKLARKYDATQSLSANEIQFCRSRLLKYAGQLTNYANENVKEMQLKWEIK